MRLRKQQFSTGLRSDVADEQIMVESATISLQRSFDAQSEENEKKRTRNWDKCLIQIWVPYSTVHLLEKHIKHTCVFKQESERSLQKENIPEQKATKTLWQANRETKRDSWLGYDKVRILWSSACLSWDGIERKTVKEEWFESTRCWSVEFDLFRPSKIEIWRYVENLAKKFLLPWRRCVVVKKA